MQYSLEYRTICIFARFLLTIIVHSNPFSTTFSVLSKNMVCQVKLDPFIRNAWRSRGIVIRSPLASPLAIISDSLTASCKRYLIIKSWRRKKVTRWNESILLKEKDTWLSLIANGCIAVGFIYPGLKRSGKNEILLFLRSWFNKIAWLQGCKETKVRHSQVG